MADSYRQVEPERPSEPGVILTQTAEGGHHRARPLGDSSFVVLKDSVAFLAPAGLANQLNRESQEACWFPHSFAPGEKTAEYLAPQPLFCRF
jgi:hypothetical protein